MLHYLRYERRENRISIFCSLSINKFRNFCGKLSGQPQEEVDEEKVFLIASNFKSFSVNIFSFSSPNVKAKFMKNLMM
jgi:hypothetical protein